MEQRIENPPAVDRRVRKLGVVLGGPDAVHNNTARNGDASGSASCVYVPKDIKRERRTKATIVTIREAIQQILSEDHPQTVRQVYYALTVRHLIKKEEIEYKRTVVRLLGEMREAAQIPFDWIADNTRWMRKPATFVGIDDCLTNTANFYRRNLWAEMPVYVEVWVEKDALAGVILEETQVYDVPLMVARGYASLSFLHGAAMAIQARGKPAYIYHFGDLDPSGVDASRDIEAKLKRYAAGAEIHFERPAVTRQQVEEWNLPSRPTKSSDPRAKKFAGTSVELDALSGQRLRGLVRECIERHVDQTQLAILRVAEESERSIIRNVAKLIGGKAA